MAKRFHFNLEPVLKFRAKIAERRLLELAEAQAKVVRQKRFLEALAGSKGESQNEIVEMYREKADFNRILDQYRFINTVNLRAAYGRQALSRHEQEEGARRNVYLEARKRKQALELLKDRRLEEHRKAENLAEAKELDELAIRRFHQERAEKRKDEG